MSKSRHILLMNGEVAIFGCPRGQRVGGKPNVHLCPLGVGGWSKKDKNLSTWLLNDPYASSSSAELFHIKSLQS